MDSKKKTVFISHSSVDDEQALYIYSALVNKGIGCWVDKYDIQPGVPYARAIMNGIVECEAMIVLVSSSSVKSDDVLNEIDKAHKEKKLLIPVFLESIEMPDEFGYYLNRRQWIMAVDNLEEGVCEIYDALSVNLDLNINSKCTKTNGEFVKENNVKNGKGAHIHINSDAKCDIFDYGTKIGSVVKVSEDCVIRLLKGKHKLKFVSLKEPSIFWSTEYVVPDNDFMDEIEVKLQSEISKLVTQRQREAESERKRKEEERDRIEKEQREAERIAERERLKACLPKKITFPLGEEYEITFRLNYAKDIYSAKKTDIIVTESGKQKLLKSKSNDDLSLKGVLKFGAAIVMPAGYLAYNFIKDFAKRNDIINELQEKNGIMISSEDYEKLEIPVFDRIKNYEYFKKKYLK